MTFILELIWSILVDTILLFPGGFIVWALRGFKGTYKQNLNDSPYKSYFAGLGFWVAVIASVTMIVNSQN